MKRLKQIFNHIKNKWHFRLCLVSYVWYFSIALAVDIRLLTTKTIDQFQSFNLTTGGFLMIVSCMLVGFITTVLLTLDIIEFSRATNEKESS